MPRKATILIFTYTIAVILVLCLYCVGAYNGLNDFRAAARYSSEHAFEETCAAMDDLSDTLSKCRYAADGAMCSKLCARAYADALSAQAAMATLPFSTYELENMNEFIGIAGDYTAWLCASASEGGLTEKQRQSLNEMAESAMQYSDGLAELRNGINDGIISFDTRERSIANVGVDEDKTQYLSASLLELEQSMSKMSMPEYDGRYSATAEKGEFALESRARAAAAEFLGVADETLVCEFETSDGFRCYSYDGMYLTLNGETVTGAASSRIVSGGRMSDEEAKVIAADFLKKRGITDVSLESCVSDGQIAYLTFAPVESGARCVDEPISVAIALDNGKLYAYGRKAVAASDEVLEWRMNPENIIAALPEGLQCVGAEKVVCLSDGETRLACYELKCTAGSGENVTIYADANTGRQISIELSA